MFFLPFDKTFISPQQNFYLFFVKLLYLDQNIYFQAKHQFIAKPFYFFSKPSSLGKNFNFFVKLLVLHKVQNIFWLNFYRLPLPNLFTYWCIGVDLTSSIIPIHQFDGIYSKFHGWMKFCCLKKFPVCHYPLFLHALTNIFLLSYFFFLIFFSSLSL